MNRTLKRTGQALLDLLYPLRCPVCLGIPARGLLVCPECRRSLPYITTHRCPVCGKSVENPGNRCADCAGMRHIFDSGTAAFLYDDRMRGLMAELKYRGVRSLGGQLGVLAFDACRDTVLSWGITALVPVPIHPSRRRSRGYNQAMEIARAVGDRMGLPVLQDAVRRREKTAAMKTLGREARQKNLAEAFAAGTTPVSGEVILIIDDIYTTGATMDAVSSVLRRGGAAGVHFFAVCIGAGFMVNY